MWAHVVWATKIKPNDEQNQTIAMCAVAGTEYLEALVRWHPDLKKNLDDYWGGHPWRDQPEIAFHIWEYIQGRISG
jgi:hypothetical protein